MVVRREKKSKVKCKNIQVLVSVIPFFFIEMALSLNEVKCWTYTDQPHDGLIATLMVNISFFFFGIQEKQQYKMNKKRATTTTTTATSYNELTCNIPYFFHSLVRNPYIRYLLVNKRNSVTGCRYQVVWFIREIAHIFAFYLID